MAVTLRNPHSILATFFARPEALVELRLPAGRPTDAWREIADLAQQHRVPILQAATRDERRRGRSHRESAGGRGGEAEATIKERPELPLETLFANPPGNGPAHSHAQLAPHKPHRLWLALDQIQDPHNVGAIFRTAAFFGIAGIIVTRDRSAPLNGTVYDVASGGVESVPYANPANLARALEAAKKAGLWILGTSEHAAKDFREVDLDRSWVLVLGNEESGLRRLTAHTCDELCRVSPHGSVGSLNVSVAAGVLMAALTRS